MKPFIPSWLNQARLPQSEFRVYCCLISRADNATGIAWPKADTIAADCMMARNTVWKALRALEGRQLIRRVGKPFQGSSRYQILMPTGANETLVDGVTSSNETPIDDATGANETPPIGANEILQSAQTRRRECNPKNVIQGRNTKSELFEEFPSERKSPMSDKLPFSSAAFADAWNDWIQHRAEIKKKLTPTSIKQQLRNFAEWGEERSITAIRHTIGNGWQGIREPDALRNSPMPAPSGTVIVNGRAFKS